jgi:hypothetical protein
MNLTAPMLLAAAAGLILYTRSRKAQSKVRRTGTPSCLPDATAFDLQLMCDTQGTCSGAALRTDITQAQLDIGLANRLALLDKSLKKVLGDPLPAAGSGVSGSAIRRAVDLHLSEMFPQCIWSELPDSIPIGGMPKSQLIGLIGEQFSTPGA